MNNIFAPYQITFIFFQKGHVQSFVSHFNPYPTSVQIQ